VTSVTADEAVHLLWHPNQESDLAGYRVYVSRDPDGPYERTGTTTRAEFWHRDLENGTTYYYGVSAFDGDGNESDLNREIVYDTPRPEGFGLVLYEADGELSDLSGFDFSREERLPWSSSRTDVYLDWVDDVGYLAVPDFATDIQDAGFADFDEITWAPEDGWSPSGFVEAIAGHVYVVWTRDNNYAKLRVTEVDAESVEVDWAYQTDRGNPELRHVATGPRPRPGTVSGKGAQP
jgi:hypothetical protein